MIGSLDDNRLIFVTGKGGVGKSSTVAALGRALARRGRRTLIVETDAFSAMAELLGVDLPTHERLRVDENLHTINLSASECIIEAIGRFVPSERVVRALVGNRIAKVFFDAAPGANEFAMLDQIRQFLEEERSDGSEAWDHVIVDLPASGHAVTFLSVPQTLNRMIRVGPIAEATGEIAKLVRDPERAAIVAVCLPEEMPVNETIELEHKLQDSLGRSLTVALANMVHRPPLDEETRVEFDRLVRDLDREALMERTVDADESTRSRLERVIAGNVLALDWHDRDSRYLERLHAELKAQVIEVPVFYEPDGAAIVERMVDFMDEETRPISDSLAS